jgi:hypothetical protein
MVGRRCTRIVTVPAATDQTRKQSRSELTTKNESPECAILGASTMKKRFSGAFSELTDGNGLMLSLSVAALQAPRAISERILHGSTSQPTVI